MDDPDTLNDETFDFGSGAGPPELKGKATTSNYVTAKIHPAEFDATQYSFFNEAEPLNDGLAGALEDGLDAPPEEEEVAFRLEDMQLENEDDLWDDVDEDEDLSLAAVFRQQAAIDNGIATTPAKAQQPAPEKSSGLTPEPSEPPMPSSMLSKMLSQHSASKALPLSPPAMHHQQQPAPPPPPPQQQQQLRAGLGTDLTGTLPQPWPANSTAPTAQPFSQALPFAPGQQPMPLPPQQQGLPLPQMGQLGMQGHPPPQMGPFAGQQLPPPGQLPHMPVDAQFMQPGMPSGSFPGPMQLPMQGQMPPPQGPPQQQGVAVPGAMTAEQLEARMLSAVQQQAPQPAANGFLAALQAGRPLPQQQPMQQQMPPQPLPQQPPMQQQGLPQRMPGQPLAPPGFPQQQHPQHAPQHSQQALQQHQQQLMLQSFLHQRGLSPEQQRQFMQALQQPALLPPQLQEQQRLLLQQFQQQVLAMQQQQQPPAMGPGLRPPVPPGHFQHQTPPHMAPHMTGPGPFPRPPPGSLSAQAQQQQQQQQMLPLQQPPRPPMPGPLPSAPSPNHERPGPGQLAQQQQGYQQGYQPSGRQPQQRQQSPQPYQQDAQQQQQQQRRNQSPSQYGLQDHRPPHQRRHHEGHKLMTADDIDYILRIQYMATHSGHPYHEDYYHQAYVHKYFGARNSATFAPEALRDLGAAAAALLSEESAAKHAALSGLGKFVLSNIRTPKLLMDVSALRGAAGGAGAGDSGPQRTLDQEPVLAARIMIEDCVNLLLDVEDVDRSIAAGREGGRGPSRDDEAAEGKLGPGYLRRRRDVLIDAILRAFKLPEAPGGGSTADGASDRVFLRIVALVKGRTFVAKTLRLLFAPGSAGAAGRVTAEGEGGEVAAGIAPHQRGLQLVWAVLRNASALFGPAVAAAAGEGDRRMVTATASLASAVSDVLKRVTQASALVDSLAAFNAGCAAAAAVASATAAAGQASALLPLYPAGRAPDGEQAWLNSVLAALLLRASELGLGSFAAAGEAAAKGQLAAAWGDAFGALFDALLRHLAALYEVKRGKQQVWGPDTGAHVHGLASMALMRVVLSHADAAQAEQLRAFLSELAH